MTTRALFNIEDDTLNKVLEIFGRSEKRLEEDTAIVIKWLESQPHLPKCTNRKLVENFLLLNKCSVEVTKQRIDMYFTVRSKVAYLYSQANPVLPHMKKFRDLVYFVPYPELSQDMCRICCFKLRDKNLGHKVEPIDIFRHLLNIVELKLRQDLVYGEIYIVDFDGLTPCLLKFTPGLIYNGLIDIYLKVFSLRVRGVYFINPPPVIKKLMAIVKSLIKAKIFARIHLCSLSDVQKRFPGDMLPVDFGGTGPSLQEIHDNLEFQFNANKNLFDSLDTMRVNEELRPKKQENDEFGFYGNFKALEID